MKKILLTALMGFTGLSSYAITDWDLTAGGSVSFNGAFFETTNFQATGTGVFNPFLDLHNEKDEGPEAAHNSGLKANKLLGDNQRDQWNSNLRYDDLVAVERQGLNYFLFTLDANEKGNGNIDRLLSIDRLQVWQSDTPDLNSEVSEGDIALGTKQWDMDLAGGDPNAAVDDNRVIIDSTLGSAGSGDADLNVFVLASFFNPALEFIYFFNANGETGLEEIKLKGDITQEADGKLAHAGFEEWRALTGESSRNELPDGGSSLALFGCALAALGFLRRKMK